MADEEMLIEFNTDKKICLSNNRKIKDNLYYRLIIFHILAKKNYYVFGTKKKYIIQWNLCNREPRQSGNLANQEEIPRNGIFPHIFSLSLQEGSQANGVDVSIGLHLPSSFSP